MTFPARVQATMSLFQELEENPFSTLPRGRLDAFDRAASRILGRVLSGFLPDFTSLSVISVLCGVVKHKTKREGVYSQVFGTLC